MQRRQFLNQTAIGTLGLALPISFSFKNEEEDFTFSLLKEWCDGMMAVQMDTPNKLTTHGALDCPACKEEADYKIHGRCLEAVYPFFYMADRTGDQRYLEAGIKAFEWGENVTMPDGSWTVIRDPNSWKGTTIFGSIALAETLRHHGHLLDETRRARWMDRLHRAANYCYEKLDVNFSNVNYACAAIYGFWLLGQVLESESYLKKSKHIASQIYQFFTPSGLLFGEGKPRLSKSGKGLPPVDLGYNVEESLGVLAQYALAVNDEKMLLLLERSLMTHLYFMLPDGGWNNASGTRQFKWTYWGSRTSDGCQVAYSLMAHRNPVFGLAARRNVELLKKCTKNGLLHGGPGYIAVDVKPCIHHTFPHAKALATILNANRPIPSSNSKLALPNSTAYGLKHVEELDTYLIATGTLCASISGYDFIYRDSILHATGGALAMLYHQQLGLLAVGSMAKYKQLEAHNQQENKGEAYPLTPRIETYVEDTWYTNLYDLKATLSATTDNGSINCEALVSLRNESFEQLQDKAAHFSINYVFFEKSLQITIVSKSQFPLQKDTYFVLPIVVDSADEETKTSKKKVILSKAKGNVLLQNNRRIKRDVASDSTVFNVVPGVSAIPYKVRLKKDSPTIIEIVTQTATD